LAIGLLWWPIAYIQGGLAFLLHRHATLLFCLAVFQLIGWGTAYLVLRRLRSTNRYLVIAVSSILLAANILWLLTPVLGAPLILLTSVVAVIALLGGGKTQSAT